MRNLANGQTVAHNNPEKGFRIHLLVYVLTIPAIWLIWFFTDKTYLWPLWQTAVWGTGLLFHYLGVFVFQKKKKINKYGMPNIVKKVSKIKKLRMIW